MEKKKECLLVDDDQDDQEIFKMCLRKVSANIHCTSANDGMEALTLLHGNPDYYPDYIFIDVNMPRMNGMECLQKIKAIERLKTTRIYMYSTTSEKTSVEATKSMGADDFIIKPSKTTELKEKLSKIFEIVSNINQ